MRVLVVGPGVIGTVYGAHLAAAGHNVSVLSHGSRTDEIARTGLVARDTTGGTSARVRVIADAGRDVYELILLSVRREQLTAAGRILTEVRGAPRVLMFGNNPGGRAAIPAEVPGIVWQGFPGVGGVLTNGVARYVRIRQQPTAVQSGEDRVMTEFVTALRTRGFTVTRVADMDGRLAYHAVFVACIAAALYRCGTAPRRLAADRATLTLMCGAISEGFTAKKATNAGGLPRNLAVLHHPLMQPVAIHYWSRMMRSPMGELCFAAHARHAKTEMLALGTDVLAEVGDEARAGHLRRLLASMS